MITSVNVIIEACTTGQYSSIPEFLVRNEKVRQVIVGEMVKEIIPSSRIVPLNTVRKGVDVLMSKRAVKTPFCGWVCKKEDIPAIVVELEEKREEYNYHKSVLIEEFSKERDRALTKIKDAIKQHCNVIVEDDRILDFIRDPLELADQIRFEYVILDVQSNDEGKKLIVDDVLKKMVSSIVALAEEGRSAKTEAGLDTKFDWIMGKIAGVDYIDPSIHRIKQRIFNTAKEKSRREVLDMIVNGDI